MSAIDANALADMGEPGSKMDWNALADMGEDVVGMSDSRSPLRQKLDEVRAESHCSLKDLTVLAPQNDPFRVDTPARHRDGEWLAVTAQELGLGERKIHLRGLHYMVLGRTKPDGSPYANTDADWQWLQSDAAKAARWLDYIPFDQIVDQRNSAPVVELFTPTPPSAYVTAALSIDIPDADDIVPTIGVRDFIGVQPYKLVFVGEKSSLAEVLTPIAQSRHADLYLPTGEISDTQLYQMARIGAEDGRPMVVLYFSDCDPAGWQMPISVSRKLQAFKVAMFPDLECEVRRVALTPEQVRQYGLPSTPLKATEQRADDWREAMGIEQTEVDALASLQPKLLAKIARAACAPFFDTTLAGRVTEARDSWLEEAQAVVDEQLDGEQVDLFREQAAAKLAEMSAEIDALNAALQVDVTYSDLPEFDIPVYESNGKAHGKPLLDSRWSFAEQCRALKASKAYSDGRQAP